MQKDKIEAKRSYQMEKTKKDTQTQIIREVQAQNIDIGDMQALNIRETQEPNMDIRETQDVQAQNTSQQTAQNSKSCLRWRNTVTRIMTFTTLVMIFMFPSNHRRLG